MKYYLIVLFSVLMASGAQMLLKQGANANYPSFWKKYQNPWVISGYGILGLSLLLNVYCMGHGIKVKEVSIIESFSYLFIPVLSWALFKERIGWKKMGAIAVIIGGIICFFL